MPTISLSLPVAGPVVTAGLHANNYTILQTLLNGGLDTANWASGKIFAPSKLMQESAVDGDGIAWDNTATIWKRTTDKALRIAALAGYPADGTKFLAGDATWKVAGGIAPAQIGTPFGDSAIGFTANQCLLAPIPGLTVAATITRILYQVSVS